MSIVKKDKVFVVNDKFGFPIAQFKSKAVALNFVKTVQEKLDS